MISAYDLMLSDAMNDLQEQVKVEHVPADKDEAGKAVSTLIQYQLHFLIAPFLNFIYLTPFILEHRKLAR